MSLYADLLGEDFVRLPEPLRSIHARPGTQRYRGVVEVRRGDGALAHLCAAAAGLPPNYSGAIEVEIVAKDKIELWTRRFGGHAMRSSLCARAGWLHERLGLVRFDFELDAVDETIVWRVARVSICGLPLPARWFAGVGAAESVRDGRYRFDVGAQLPGIGLLVHYSGLLDVR